jgi:hypothetical protein
MDLPPALLLSLSKGERKEAESLVQRPVLRPAHAPVLRSLDVARELRSLVDSVRRSHSWVCLAADAIFN